MVVSDYQTRSGVDIAFSAPAAFDQTVGYFRFGVSGRVDLVSITGGQIPAQDAVSQLQTGEVRVDPAAGRGGLVIHDRAAFYRKRRLVTLDPAAGTTGDISADNTILQPG